MRWLLVPLLLLPLVTACHKAHRAPRCYTSADCGSGQLCALFASEAHVCVDRCDQTATALCSDGRACVAIAADDAQTDVCLPGGPVALGGTCATSVECAKGAVCLLAAGQSAPTCVTLCEVGGANVCAGGESCVAIDAAASTTRGTCVGP